MLFLLLRRFVMSKENAVRFLIAKDKDEDLKSAFKTTTDKYAGRNLSEDESYKMLQEEIIPLAKEYGYDFTPEDLKELQKPDAYQLSEEELDAVTGGLGQFIIPSVTKEYNLYTITLRCELVQSNEVFKIYFDQKKNGCNYFVPANTQDHACKNCANLRAIRKDKDVSFI
jgi:predicted ribosomally synthesized peptide with nif11-like leader